MLKTIFGDRGFLKAMLTIAIPISIQSLIQSSLNMIDQFMIGRLGETAMVSVGLGGRLPFILMITLMGITTAASIFTAQYWGKKDHGKIGEVLGSALVCGFIVTAIFQVISWWMPNQVLGIYSTDPTIIAQGSQYLKIISFTYVPLLLVMTYSSVLRSTENVKLPMYVGMLSVVVNTILNYIMIFGMFGLPAMGISGAAYATVISRLVEAALLMGITYTKGLPGAVPLKNLFSISDVFMKRFLVTAMPLLLNELLWVIGDSTFSVIYGRMGIDEMAAMTMTFPIQGMSIGFMTGLGAATGIMLGNKLGNDENEEAIECAWCFIALGILGASVVGVLIILLSHVYVGVYNVSPQVQDYAIKLLMIFGLILWVKISNMIVGGGILRSGGVTKITLFLELFGMWGIGVPLGFLAAFVLELPIQWVYLFVSIEEMVRLAIGLRLTSSRRWIKNITKEVDCVATT